MLFTSLSNVAFITSIHFDFAFEPFTSFKNHISKIYNEDTCELISLLSKAIIPPRELLSALTGRPSIKNESIVSEIIYAYKTLNKYKHIT